MVKQDMTKQDATLELYQLSERFKGYTLFTDIEDDNVRCRNQGTMLANIYEDHCAGGVINKIGALTVIGYMSNIPDRDRRLVKDAYDEALVSRGFTTIPVRGE